MDSKPSEPWIPVALVFIGALFVFVAIVGPINGAAVAPFGLISLAGSLFISAWLEVRQPRMRWRISGLLFDFGLREWWVQSSTISMTTGPS